MNQTIKNTIGVVSIVAIAIFAIVGWRAVSFYGNSIDPSSVRSFSVSAEGKSVVTPDIAKVTMGTITEGGLDLAALQTQNTEKVNSLIALAKEQGVEDKDIQTASYRIIPRRQQVRCDDISSLSAGKTICPPPEIVGYGIHQDVRITVRDFETLGTLLSGGVSRGANFVLGPVFSVDDPVAAKKDAREQAIARAEEQAQQTAAAAGFELGELLSVHENSGNIPFFRSFDEAVGLGGVDGVPAPQQFEPGSEDVTVNITLTYRIK